MDWDYNTEKGKAEEKEAWKACYSYVQQNPNMVAEFLKEHDGYPWNNPEGMPYAYDVIEWKLKDYE